MRRKYAFPYPGSKGRLCEELVNYLPRHVHYVSVFGGAASDIIAKPPSDKETFNDKDEHIYNLFKVIQHRRKYKELRSLIKDTKVNKSQFGWALWALACKDAVLRAHAFLIAQYQGWVQRHAALMYDNSWNKGCAGLWNGLPEFLDEIHDRFKAVVLLQKDWREIITAPAGENTFFFLDPPYHPDTIKGRSYVHMMSARAHRDMVSILLRQNAKVMLVSYDNADYNNYLGGWRSTILDDYSSVRKEDVTVKVWMNYGKAA